MVILAVLDKDGQRIVTVAPITHSPPRHPDSAVEIPAATKVRLGLDQERSWIVVADLNRFVWPGVDLRPIRRSASGFVHGWLPNALYEAVKAQVLTLAKAGRMRVTMRQD